MRESFVQKPPEVNPDAIKAIKMNRRSFLQKLLVGATSVAIGNSLLMDSGKEEKSEEFFQDLVVKAKEEMQQFGITEEQRQAYVEGVSEQLFKNITPYHYDDGKGPLKRLVSVMINRPDDPESSHTTGLYATPQDKERDDSWRLYLGLPQKDNTFTISNFRPTRGQQLRTYFCFKKDREEEIFKKIPSGPLSQIQNDATYYAYPPEKLQENEIARWRRDDLVMGTYICGIAYDPLKKKKYRWYYDVWDFEVPFGQFSVKLGDSDKAGKPKTVGLGLEIYNRQYEE